MLTDDEIERNISIYSEEKKQIEKSLNKIRRELSAAEKIFINQFCTEEYKGLREKLILFFYRRCNGKNSLSLMNFDIDSNYFSKADFNIYNRTKYDCISTNVISTMKSVWTYRSKQAFKEQYVVYSKLLKAIKHQEETKSRTVTYTVSDFHKMCIKYKIDPSYQNYKYICKDFMSEDEFNSNIQNLIDDQKVKTTMKLLAKKHM